MYAELLLIFGTTLLIWWLVGRQKFPKTFPKGPTGIPILGYMPWLFPDLHIAIGKLSKKYGNIFSVKLGGETYVVLNDFDSVKAAMKQDVFAGRPNHLLAMDAFKNGIPYSMGRLWTEQRRFAVKTLRDFGFGKQKMDVMIQEAAADLIQHYRGRMGRPEKIGEMFPIVALNCLWLMLVGDKLPLDDERPKKIFKLGKEGIFGAALEGPLYVLPWLAKIAPEMTGYNLLWKAKEQINELITEIIEHHKRTIIPGEPRDYIDMYLEKREQVSNDKESSFSGQLGINCLIDTMLAFFLAGADTLASTMDYTILFLLKNPKEMMKVQEEIDRVVGKSRAPNITDRPLMPYTEAVMAETLRLSAIVPGAVLHSTMDDVEFQGHLLPKGTIIYPNLYQIHHEEKYWGDPKNFRPQRFINADGTFRKDERVIAFGVGKRECPAFNIAMVEYFLFLTNLLQAFDITADPKSKLPGNEAKTSFVMSCAPYSVIFAERK